MSTTAPSSDDIRRSGFESELPLLQRLVEQRRRTWTVSHMPWEDCRQLLLIRLWRKWHLFDPAKGPLERWANRLISHALTNILRDCLYRHIRPCLRDGGCTYNMGGDACSYTVNGLQCNLCPLYAEWKEKRETEHNIRSSLALECHAQEVSNMPSDSFDVEAAKAVIDAKMLSRLTPWDRRIYRLLFQRNLTPQDVAVRVAKAAARRKTPLDPEDAVDYQSVLKTQRMMKEAMKVIIRTEYGD